MHTPTLALEEMVAKGELKHDGNPVMRWMISNVIIDRDPAGNIKPTKGKSSGKIDGVVAAIMAIGASIKTEKKVSSIYNNWQDEFDDDE
jgi:phage terminase large subunit-like protein